MIKRIELLTLANEKILDAIALKASNRFDGAAYLCGYSVELFLKYRLCKQLKWDKFPSTNKEFEDLKWLKTHNLEFLIRLSGVEKKVRRQFFADWSILVRWSPEDRYNASGTVLEKDVDEMILAAKRILKLT